MCNFIIFFLVNHQSNLGLCFWVEVFLIISFVSLLHRLSNQSYYCKNVKEAFNMWNKIKYYIEHDNVIFTFNIMIKLVKIVRQDSFLDHKHIKLWVMGNLTSYYTSDEPKVTHFYL
jgi:hypothetical protein